MEERFQMEAMPSEGAPGTRGVSTADYEPPRIEILGDLVAVTQGTGTAGADPRGTSV
jgi:hypothetical protein